jgi:hypothetical protein
VGVVIGVGQVGLDVEQEYAMEKTASFWGLDSTDGHIVHCSHMNQWEGMQPFGTGDTLGLLLNCGAGCLVVYKKGAMGEETDEWGEPVWDNSVEGMTRLGVPVTGLSGELCWAVSMSDKGDSVRITGKPPPVSWRDAHV